MSYTPSNVEKEEIRNDFSIMLDLLTLCILMGDYVRYYSPMFFFFSFPCLLFLCLLLSEYQSPCKNYTFLVTSSGYLKLASKTLYYHSFIIYPFC
jgi:hypothetical protein